jgi:hypothetical protein
LSVLLKKGLARQNPDMAAGQPHQEGATSEPEFDTLSDPDEMTMNQKRRYYYPPADVFFPGFMEGLPFFFQKKN